MTHTCLHCKNRFAPTRLNQFYCRQSCRQGAYLVRKGIVSVKSQNKPENKPPGIDLASLLGNIEPEMLIQLLSGFNKNPSMTDNVTDKVDDSPVNIEKTSENPSQSVNDGLRKRTKTVHDFQENLHEKDYNGINTEMQDNKKIDPNTIFAYMLDKKFTISIPPNGFVRSLFPHWIDKEWYLSLEVNGKMLQIFQRLQKASFKNVISYSELSDCCKQAKKLCDGFYGFCLPEDYPFINFVRMLAKRLTQLTNRAHGKSEIKFTIPEELMEMMMVLKVQIQSED